MNNRIEKTIQSQNWPNKVVLAVSGGVDSVVLLDAFCRFLPDVQVSVAHVNYQLRQESDGDAVFVESLATKYQVNFYQKVAPIGTTTGVESLARKIRYDFFDEIKEKTSAQAIVLAQHQDDQVETLLLQLIRGGLVQKKTGMATKNGYYRRPFLSLTKDDLKQYAYDFDLHWREDKTNHDPEYTGRNKLRQEIIPALAKINPKAKEHLAQFATLETENQRLIASQVQQYLPLFEKNYETVPKIWREKVLIAWLQNQGIYKLNERQIQQILSVLDNLAKPNARVDLGENQTFVKAYQQISLINPEKNQKYTRKPEGLVLKLEQWQFFNDGLLGIFKNPPKNAQKLLQLSTNLVEPLTLELASKDDKVNIKSGRKAVRRILIDQKIPVLKRGNTWLLKDQQDKVLALYLGESSWYKTADFPKITELNNQWLVWRRIEEN